MKPSHSFFNAFTKSQKLSFLGVGDAVSALLATRSGASALWASSLCVSTSLGLRDASELTITELARVTSLMRDQTELPILVDGDSGYGENHVTLRLCRELARAGASGVCLEDKPFPKVNSHFGERPELVDIDAFCNKLDCLKQNLHTDFFLVARTEAFVAKKTLVEGLERCQFYAEAGADAILFTLRDFDELLLKRFSQQWSAPDVPLIFIPPPSVSVTNEAIFKLGYQGIVWANQAMRSALNAFEESCRVLIHTGNSAELEKSCLTMKELFDFLGYALIEPLNQNNRKIKCKERAF